MKLEDVLLTEKEWQTSRHDTCKAQCLKLLDVLSKPCKSPVHYHKTLRGRSSSRKDCLGCMSELEKILKEG